MCNYNHNYQLSVSIVLKCIRHLYYFLAFALLIYFLLMQYLICFFFLHTLLPSTGIYLKDLQVESSIASWIIVLWLFLIFILNR